MAKVAIKSEKLSPFGGIFSIMEQFDSNLSSVIDSPRYEMQAVWLSIQRNHPFAYERLFLWRLMHRGCHHSSDVPPLASSDTSHMQCRHDSQSGRIVTDCKLDDARSLQFLAVNARFTRCAV